MDKKVYVGSPPHSLTDHDLQNLFEAHGIIQSTQVILDQDTNRSKAPRMSKEGNGRALTVEGARPADERLWRSGLEYASDFFG